MPPKRAAPRKRQAKLAFSPVPSSSPAAKTLSPQVRDRAAVVTLKGSPSGKRASKKRKLTLRDDSDSDAQLPAPKRALKSGNVFNPSPKELKRNIKAGMPVHSQKYGMFGGSDDDDDGVSISSSSESDAAPEPPSTKTKDMKSTRQTRQTRIQLVSSDDDSEAAAEVPKKATKRTMTSKQVPVKSESESEAKPAQESPKRRTRSTKVKFAAEPPKKEKQSKKAKAAPPPDGEGSEDDEDIAPPTSQRKSKKQTKPSPPKREAKAKKAKAVPPPDSEDSKDEDDIAPPTSQRQSKRLNKPSPVHETSEEDSENEPAPPTPRRRLVNRRKPSQDEDEDGEESDGDDSNASDHPDGHEDDSDEQNELRDEVADLRSSPPRLSSSHGKKLNARQQALADLKKRRAGASGSAPRPSSASTPGRKRAVVIDSDDGGSDSSLVIVSDDEESDDEEPSDFEEAVDIFQEQSGDEGFLDDDPNALLGEPTEIERLMPIGLSKWANKKPRELFKFAVEWMVKKKISPAFDSNDELYGLAFRKLDDELNGLANSKYSSAAWTPAFTRALRARPQAYFDELGAGLRGLDAYCEACNRKSHPATWTVRFTGKPYNRETLEPLNEDDSDDSDDSDSSAMSSASEDSDDDLGYAKGEKRDYDAQGELLLPESKVFALGVTCKANAKMAHTLHHWRQRLNAWVQDYLVKNGYMTPEKLVTREKRSERKREKEANKIVDRMEKDGEIDRLHRHHKDAREVAQAEQEQYQGRWGRG